MTMLSLDQQLCFAIYSAGHAFNRAYKPFLDGLGLTYPQYLVMLVLWEEDELTVGAIGEKLHLESSTLTPLLKRMEQIGLLKRARDPKDERQVRIQLTAAGKRLQASAREIPKCLLKASGVSAETLARIKREVMTVRDNLLASGLGAD